MNMIWIGILFLPLAEAFLLPETSHCTHSYTCYRYHRCPFGEHSRCKNATCTCIQSSFAMPGCSHDLDCHPVRCSTGEHPTCINGGCVCRHRTAQLSSSCTHSSDCGRVICSSDDYPICLNSKCVCRRKFGYCTRDSECDGVHCGRSYHPYCYVAHNICGCMHAPPHDSKSCTSDRSCVNMHCPEHEHNVKRVCHARKCHCMKDIEVAACGAHVRRRSPHPPHPPEYECPDSMCGNAYSKVCLSSQCACTRKPLACHSDHDCSNAHCPSHQTTQCFDSSCYCVDITTTSTTTTTTTTTKPTTKTVGHFSEWQAWGHCSATCEGIKLRFRTCQGHGSCNGNTTEIHQCGANHCPVNGMLTAWGSWTICSATCGGGTQMRSRTCIPPQHGGRDCDGSLYEVNSHCNSDACTVIGQFNEWQAWGQCTATCEGIKVRMRSCQVAGSCHGDTNQVHHCGSQFCPVDGTLTPWGSWTPCSATCGGGYHVRTRTCTPPQHGGKNCAGPLFEVNSDCNPESCQTPTTTTTTTTAKPTTTTTMTTTTSLTATTSLPVTGANTGVQCPHCDSSKTCTWNRTCPGSETCMIRSPQSANSTLHCSVKQDCLFIKSVLPSGEINCCDDRGCIEEHLGLVVKGVQCPHCDEVLTCNWNRTCPDSQTCMIRSFQGFKFSVHCSVADDCQFIKAALPSGEIYCCNDRQCLSKYLGI